jgi:hypothetical protein
MINYSNLRFTASKYISANTNRVATIAVVGAEQQQDTKKAKRTMFQKLKNPYPSPHIYRLKTSLPSTYPPSATPPAGSCIVPKGTAPWGAPNPNPFP